MSSATLPAVQSNGGGHAPARVQLGGAMAMQQTIEDLNVIRQFVSREMREGLDFGTIPGTGGKPTLLQPGAQKILMYFNAYPDFEVEPHDLDGGHVEYIVKTKLYSRASQTLIGTGIGSASTMESKYRWRKGSRTCPKCGNGEAFIKGKEEYGGGWICFNKKGGCGAKFQTNDPAITSQSVSRVENPDIHDQRNTVLKMAKKRSLVDSTHGLGCMSELFTQDLEDYHDVPVAQTEPPAPARHDDGRREVNESFPARSTPRAPSDDTQDDAGAMPARRQEWDDFILDRMDQARKHWSSEMAIAGVPVTDQKRPEFQMPNVHEVINHFVNHGLEKGSIKPEDVDKDGKPGTRDPKKARAALADLYRRAPKKLRAAVDEYFAAKERDIRVKLGMDDVEPEDESQEPLEPEVVGREPGCDDDRE